MSFPDIGVAIPGASAGSNIKFSQLRTSWGQGGYFNGSDPSSSEDGNNISLSAFNDAPFTDDTVISSGSAISIGTHFCDKTFIVPVTGATVSASTTNVPENYTISDFASVDSVEPDEANGTIKFQFSDSNNGYAIADSTDLVDSELPDPTVMGYTFGSVDQDERFEEITVTIYQSVGGSDTGVHSEIISDFTIRDSGGGR